MRVIGLTGGIACGKSTVSRWLQEQPGCRTIDADQLSRELCATGGAALPVIREAFGAAVFLPDGTLNRRRLGALVFADPEKRALLDRVMAPLLEELTLQRIQQAKADGAVLCFLDYPLLFEKGYDRFCDSVWCVVLPRDIQLRRLMDRDGLSEEEALQRMNAVLSSEEKASRSTVVIDNSGEVAFTLSLLPPLLEAEMQKSAQTERRRRSDRYQPAPASDVRTVPSGGPPEPSGLRPEKPAGGPSAPLTMDRPAHAGKRRHYEKAVWRLPSWLITLLILFAFLLAASFTAQKLMEGYLVRMAEQHAAEDRSIHAHYPSDYRELIEQAAAEYNLNPAFVFSIVLNESSFQPLAESSVGARGLMQLMPDTAEWIAGKIRLSGYSFERMFDPESNLRFGCWYLRYLASLFHGDPVCVSSAYHAGQGQVTAWLSDSRFSTDGVHLELSRMADGPTKTYAGRVIRAYGIYQALYYPDSVHSSDDHDASVLSGLGE